MAFSTFPTAPNTVNSQAARRHFAGLLTTTRAPCAAEGHWLVKDGVKMRHGKGMFIEGVPDSSTTPQSYEGEWKEDAMSGYGVFRYATNAKYEVRGGSGGSGGGRGGGGVAATVAPRHYLQPEVGVWAHHV